MQGFKARNGRKRGRGVQRHRHLENPHAGSGCDPGVGKVCNRLSIARALLQVDVIYSLLIYSP